MSLDRRRRRALIGPIPGAAASAPSVPIAPCANVIRPPSRPRRGVVLAGLIPSPIGAPTAPTPTVVLQRVKRRPCVVVPPRVMGPIGAPNAPRPTVYAPPFKCKPGVLVPGRVVGPIGAPDAPTPTVIRSFRRPGRGQVVLPRVLSTPAAPPGVAPPTASIIVPRGRRRPGIVSSPWLPTPIGAPNAPQAIVITPQGRRRAGIVLVTPALSSTGAPSVPVPPQAWVYIPPRRARRGQVLVQRLASPMAAPSVPAPPVAQILIPPFRPLRRALLVSRNGIPSETAAGTGYNIYANGGSGPIDYSTPIATVSGLTWTSTALSYPADWKFGVRAYNANGEEKNLDAFVEIILDSGGNDITNRPLPPLGLRAFATAAAGVRVEWAYAPMQPAKLPTGFNVYIGTGGAPSYGSPVATVSYQSAIAGSWVANLSGLSGGTTYAVGVRAYNAVAEEPNTVFVSVTADAAGPAPVVSLTATAVAG